MSVCAGKDHCNIYRDKKFCRRAKDLENKNGICDCRHAVPMCEVEHCPLLRICQYRRADK